MDDFTLWANDFEAFCKRFAPLFHRSETREEFRLYLQGLLHLREHRGAGPVARSVGQHDPQPLQRLLRAADWDAEAVRDALQQFIREEFGHPEAVCVLEESGFVKRGAQSAGVERQWCRPLERIENCQVGLFEVYVSPYGTVILDRCLLLPETWRRDDRRRQAAKIPAGIEFADRCELGGAMVERAWKQGMPMRWIVGDSQYGDSPELGEQIARRGLFYLLGVSTHQFVQRAEGLGTGRETLQPPQAISAVVMQWPQARWQRLTTVSGEARSEEWGCERVYDYRSGRRGQAVRLLARRLPGTVRNTGCFVSNAAPEVPLEALARVASAQQAAQECLQACRDSYEVRSWRGWHRHITLSQVIYAWLASLERQYTPPLVERSSGDPERPK